MGEFAPLSARAVERLRRMLDGTNPELWPVAFPILLSSGADGRALTPEILVGLGVVQGPARSDFVRTLYDLVPLDDAVIRKLKDVQSNDPDQMVRAVAGAVVWRNGTPEKEGK